MATRGEAKACLAIGSWIARSGRIWRRPDTGKGICLFTQPVSGLVLKEFKMSKASLLSPSNKSS